MTTSEEHAAHNTESEKRILGDVEMHGFHIAFFEKDGDSPGFGYTIGLFKTYGYPELIIFGLTYELTHSMFWTAKEFFDKYSAPDLTAEYPDFLEGYNVRFLTVDKARYSDYFGYARWFYSGYDFPALQIVWPDKKAFFPWQDGFNANWKFLQPLLDRNTDFRFREERNVAVFTTRQVLEGAPILRVSHETDGDWQFLCDTTTDVADLKVVALEEVTKRDPTINELYDLKYGWSAWRETPDDTWETWEQEEAENEE